ncbi:MAG: hypothetical protein AB7O37_15600 [Vicinamibacteria bacterium]
MAEILKFMRFFFVLLAIFTIGRWGMSLGGVPYEKGTHVFSLVTLTLIAVAHHAAFARGLLGWRIGKALQLGATMAFTTQLVILLSTVVSYFGLPSYFNAPLALNQEAAVPLTAAVVIRLQGLVINTILGTIAAALGYLMGGALPKREKLA